MLGDDAKFTGNMNIHEAKGDPVALPATKIVSGSSFVSPKEYRDV